MLTSYLFKAKFKIDQKFNAKIYKTMVFKVILRKHIEKKKANLTCLILRFDFHLKNGNIFVKSVARAFSNKALIFTIG